MRLLVTGCSGFVSQHFLELLEQTAVDAELLGVARHAPSFEVARYRHLRCSFRELDLLDRAGVRDVIASFAPTHVLHLAAYSSVGFSWKHPVDSFTNNTNILLNVLDELRALRPSARVLSVGSSEQYGDVSAADLPLREDGPIRPVSPYAVARVSQEMLSKIYVSGYGMDVVMTRSFNHIGPGQRDAFVVPSLAKQLVAIRDRGAPPVLKTGDHTVVRDFIDVRDVVRAYWLLLREGTRGEVYNVCGGRGTSISALIATMQAALGTRAEVEIDPSLVRPNDNRAIVGSHDKLTRAVGWTPKIALSDSIADIVAWFRSAP
jgi:GDP-4-dehydro-6-deoxy-D-mannose reductase